MINTENYTLIYSKHFEKRWFYINKLVHDNKNTSSWNWTNDFNLENRRLYH